MIRALSIAISVGSVFAETGTSCGAVKGQLKGRKTQVGGKHNTWAPCECASSCFDKGADYFEFRPGRFKEGGCSCYTGDKIKIREKASKSQYVGNAKACYGDLADVECQETDEKGEQCTFLPTNDFAAGMAQRDLGCIEGVKPTHDNFNENLLNELGISTDLRTLNEGCPLNAEPLQWQLDSDITPNNLFYVRNNGEIPDMAMSQDDSEWNLVLDGFVNNPTTYTIQQLRDTFTVHRRTYVLQCAGHGRAGYNPPVSGNQWTVGPVGNAEWEGVLLKDVLERAGLQDAAVYVAWEAMDTKCGKEDVAVSRGVPVRKAMDGFTMLAWSMNGEPLPAAHGFPLRLIAPGFPGAAQGKWLKRLWIRDVEHDGAKMTGHSYRYPTIPIKPGVIPETSEGYKVIEEMPVYSIITHPMSCATIGASRTIQVRGKAWSGEGDVDHVDVSIDFGQTWLRATLNSPVNKYAWQNWYLDLTFPNKGYYEVYARATDNKNRVQPMVVPGWNHKGYLNNAVVYTTITVSE